MDAMFEINLNQRFCNFVSQPIVSFFFDAITSHPINFHEHDVINYPQGKFQRVYDNTRLCLRQKFDGFWCVFDVVLCILLCQECGLSIWVYLTCLKIHDICVWLCICYRFCPNAQKKKLCRFPFIFFLPAPTLANANFWYCCSWQWQTGHAAW